MFVLAGLWPVLVKAGVWGQNQLLYSIHKWPFLLKSVMMLENLCKLLSVCIFISCQSRMLHLRELLLQSPRKIDEHWNVTAFVLGDCLNCHKWHTFIARASAIALRFVFTYLHLLQCFPALSPIGTPWLWAMLCSVHHWSEEQSVRTHHGHVVSLMQ